MVIWQRDDRRAQPVIEVAYGEMVDWRARSLSFDDLAVVGSVNWSLNLVGPNAPEQVTLSAVSSSFFSVVGASPIVGRALEPRDEDGPIPRVMIISHGLWLRRFGGDPGIVGRMLPVKLDAEGQTISVAVVGVMPEAFDYPRGAEVWVPAAPLVRKFGAAFGADDTLRYIGWLRPSRTLPPLSPVRFWVSPL